MFLCSQVCEKWLVHPDGKFTSSNIRIEIIRLLAMLPVETDHIRGTCKDGNGIGITLMDMWKHPDVVRRKGLMFTTFPILALNCLQFPNYVASRTQKAIEEDNREMVETSLRKDCKLQGMEAWFCVISVGCVGEFTRCHLCMLCVCQDENGSMRRRDVYVDSGINKKIRSSIAEIEMHGEEVDTKDGSIYSWLRNPKFVSHSFFV